MTDQLMLIGAAYPRTGTMSVKRALEFLGLGRCYHMSDVWVNPDHVPVWNAAYDGHMPDWRTLLAGYAATLDTPACLFWKELAAAYPEAKVLLLQRDPDTWYESMRSTVYQTVMGPDGNNDPALRMVRRILFDQTMAGRFEDREFAKATYRRYCERVKEDVPDDRLLVYEVSQGWEPLCSFLGYDVPDEAFPRANTRAEFVKRNALTRSNGDATAEGGMKPL
ncbi:MAG: sulfotransferase family protein [bacterium]|nr:sulfotransferase family protein [bacterium]